MPTARQIQGEQFLAANPNAFAPTAVNFFTQQRANQLIRDEETKKQKELVEAKFQNDLFIQDQQQVNDISQQRNKQQIESNAILEQQMSEKLSGPSANLAAQGMLQLRSQDPVTFDQNFPSISARLNLLFTGVQLQSARDDNLRFGAGFRVEDPITGKPTVAQLSNLEGVDPRITDLKPLEDSIQFNNVLQPDGTVVPMTDDELASIPLDRRPPIVPPSRKEWIWRDNGFMKVADKDLLKTDIPIARMEWIEKHRGGLTSMSSTELRVLNQDFRRLESMHKFLADIRKNVRLEDFGFIGAFRTMTAKLTGKVGSNFGQSTIEMQQEIDLFKVAWRKFIASDNRFNLRDRDDVNNLFPKDGVWSNLTEAYNKLDVVLSHISDKLVDAAGELGRKPIKDMSYDDIIDAVDRKILSEPQAINALETYDHLILQREQRRRERRALNLGEFK